MQHLNIFIQPLKRIIGALAVDAVLMVVAILHAPDVCVDVYKRQSVGCGALRYTRPRTIYRRAHYMKVVALG